MTDPIDLTVDIGAALVGAVGLLLAVLANRRAQQANQAAQVANRLAADALTEARTANRIAEQANQLSQEANTVVSAQAADQRERWHVEFAVEWNEEDGALAVRNLGADPARQVTVVVSGDDFHHAARGLGDLPAGEQLALPLPKVVEQRDDATREWDRIMSDPTSNMIVPSLFHIDARVAVTWETGLGQARHADLEVQLT